MRRAALALGPDPERAKRQRCPRAPLRRISSGSPIPSSSPPLAADPSREVVRSLVPKYGLDTVSQIALDDDRSVLRLKAQAILR
jgi:hypothetical protein